MKTLFLYSIILTDKNLGMYAILLGVHSATRYFVVVSLVIAILMATYGYTQKKAFSESYNSIRHWTATIAHIQLIVGMLLYFKSPIVLHFMKNTGEALKSVECLFFGLYHAVAMFVAIVLITIGSALTKRKKVDREKFKTMLVWFTIALIILFLAIPWPFSPFANRPYFRPF